MQQKKDELAKKIRSISNDKNKKNGNHEKYKLEYYKEIIEGKLNDIKNFTTRKLIETAWTNCKISSCMMMLRKNFLNEIYLVQNIDFDRSNLVLFKDLPLNKAIELINLKNSNQKKYIEKFQTVIECLKVVERVISITKKNYYIHDRLKIISGALSFFKCGNYMLFVYLIVPQIEGLFRVLKEPIMLNDLHAQTMKKLIEQINEVEKFEESVYFLYDFPMLRNKIAHGYIIDVDIKMAYEMVMVLYYIIDKIDSEEHDYKKIMSFLEDFYDKKNMEDLVNRIEKYFTPNKNKKYIRILRRYFEGKFDSMLKWYGFEKKKDKFSEIINKDEFYSSLWNNDSLEIEEVIEVIKEDGAKKKEICKKPNDASCKYADFLALLDKCRCVPGKWYQDYKLFLKKIEQSNKNRIKQLNKNKHLNQ